MGEKRPARAPRPRSCAWYLDRVSAALAPLVIVGVMMLATLGLVVASRAQRARLRQADAHATADAIARRLGLRFRSGDPYVNLAHPGNGPVDVRLEGSCHGRATTLTYRFRTRDATQLSDALIGRDVTAIESVAHVEVACRARRGRFEVRHRARGGLDAQSVFDPRDPIPRRRFGSDLDAHLVVDADDADVPALLAPHLGLLATLGYVHVTRRDRLRALRDGRVLARLAGHRVGGPLRLR